MTDMNLAGRTALVTGASRGIGRGIALALAKAGADIAVNYTRDGDAAAETVAEIQALGRKTKAYQASVAEEEASAAMVAAIEADFGPLSILVNNAGIASRGRSVADTDAAEVEKLLAIHAVGAHRLSRLALPQLRQHDRSDIVIISSIATLHHAANGAPYNMAKAAGEALALTLAKEEVKNGVRVNIVAPSLTVSDMGERLARAITGNDDIHHLDTKFPFGRVPTPDDVAAAVVWFVSEANPYCSGQKLNIDGAGQASFR
ncbi:MULTISPECIES: SDR family oxidoreductase [unclassified Sphingopyxis]|uniref:SDR family NAD(P)-dependent oxidoreductase n=1 Tax=unclassified Sphingopyxis TaxID=2614943 RepID=UPI0007313FE2|nr:MULTISPECIES: SDR family oxidoreductase [unclassified Sphingopyxis]KTE22999.1 oxidoreductase [Sphingopyxis sp. H057]KTE49720.1 oxidoreductase [Sphingopyxis sp. H073]KTE54136.1 oxidoreductase [Sphingopyxis sp. H071]KTE58056.1 oxidoreductase [Sphingopyxis sp. H107]KTE60400.1 oxidoreductase [Sphingopyxis sp. H100]